MGRGLTTCGRNLLVAAIMLLIRGGCGSFYHTPALSQYMGAFALLMILGSFASFFGQSLAGFKDVARRT